MENAGNVYPGNPAKEKHGWGTPDQMPGGFSKSASSLTGIIPQTENLKAK
jgi:hypothetical protein